MAETRTIAKLVTDLTLNSVSFETAMDRATARMRGFGDISEKESRFRLQMQRRLMEATGQGLQAQLMMHDDYFNRLRIKYAANAQTLMMIERTWRAERGKIIADAGERKTPKEGSVAIFGETGAKFIKAAAGVQVATGAVRLMTAAVAAANGNFDKMNESLRSLPLGIGPLASEFAELFEEISGRAEKARRDTENLAKFMAFQKPLNQAHELRNKIAGELASVKITDAYERRRNEAAKQAQETQELVRRLSRESGIGLDQPIFSRLIDDAAALLKIKRDQINAEERIAKGLDEEYNATQRLKAATEGFAQLYKSRMAALSGLSPEQQALFNLKESGASSADIAVAERRIKTMQHMEERARLRSQAERWAEQGTTPLDKFKSTLKDISNILDREVTGKGTDTDSLLGALNRAEKEYLDSLSFAKTGSFSQLTSSRMSIQGMNVGADVQQQQLQTAKEMLKTMIQSDANLRQLLQMDAQ